MIKKNTSTPTAEVVLSQSAARNATRFTFDLIIDNDAITFLDAQKLADDLLVAAQVQSIINQNGGAT
jgi:hypothetical protein